MGILVALHASGMMSSSYYTTFTAFFCLFLGVATYDLIRVTGVTIRKVQWKASHSALRD